MEAIRKDYYRAGFLILAEELYDGVLWVVGRAAGEAVPFLTAYLMERDGSMWGYKAISEAAGPYAVCPQHLLDMVPPVNAEFRKRCAS
jgi:hypothetical protein